MRHARSSRRPSRSSSIPLTHAQMRAVPVERVMAVPERRAAAQAIMERLVELRVRCQRQTSSLVTPMGDEMFYRYQQSLIDEAATTVARCCSGPQASPVARQAPRLHPRVNLSIKKTVSCRWPHRQSFGPQTEAAGYIGEVTGPSVKMDASFVR